MPQRCHAPNITKQSDSICFHYQCIHHSSEASNKYNLVDHVILRGDMKASEMKDAEAEAEAEDC